MLDKNFKEMFRCLLAQDVDFLLVGGYAVAAYGYPRATKDIDIWVWANPNNAQKIIKALAEFGAPLHEITEEDLKTEGMVFRIGVPPLRIDIVTKIDGVSFGEAYPNRTTEEIEGLKIPMISKADLIRNKKASGRMQDLADVEKLENP